MRVRVGFRRLAVSGSPGVGDSGFTRGFFLPDLPLKDLNLPHLPRKVGLGAQYGDSAGVMPPVFKPLRALNQNIADGLMAGIGDDAAHNRLPAFKIIGLSGKLSDIPIHDGLRDCKTCG
jgi:hypothetical protein